ncbi:hypothetical protein BDR07DRAFT_1410317 [Suillus spraguei]|nr:hypothetical protein BDR07DRAFT_1410317 [Suillus spraguei]
MYLFGGKFFLSTVFMKLCLIRGLISVVKLAFASEDIDLKDNVRTTSGSPCLLDYFLSQWDGWLEFDKPKYVNSKGFHYHRRLLSIVISDRISEFALGHVRITHGGTCSLDRLAAGDWTALPPVCPMPYNGSQPHCLRMWNSPPDPNPTEIEMTPWKTSQRLMERAEWIFRAKQVELEE